MKIMFGGVPMRLPTPPRLAPYATASTTHAAKFRSPVERAAGAATRARRTVAATGISIRAVAALLTHIEIAALAMKKPRTNFLGREPAMRTTA